MEWLGGHHIEVLFAQVSKACPGDLLPLIWRSMPDLGPSFRQFADGLKERADR